MQTIDPPANPATTTVWHLYRGTVRYFILGPGSSAMHPCSEPVYEGRHPTMTAEESRIANIAVDLLRQRHSQDTSAGVEEIKRALADAAAGVKPAKPKPAAMGPKSVSPLKPESVVIDPADIRRVKQVVAGVTGVSIAQIESVSTAATAGISAAKSLYFGALTARWPRAEQRQLAAAVNRSASTFSNTLQRHHYNNESFTDYARKFRRILEQLGLDPATR